MLSPYNLPEKERNFQLVEHNATSIVNDSISCSESVKLLRLFWTQKRFVFVLTRGILTRVLYFSFFIFVGSTLLLSRCKRQYVDAILLKIPIIFYEHPLELRNEKKNAASSKVKMQFSCWAHWYDKAGFQMIAGPGRLELRKKKIRMHFIMRNYLC